MIPRKHRSIAEGRTKLSGRRTVWNKDEMTIAVPIYYGWGSFNQLCPIPRNWRNPSLQAMLDMWRRATWRSLSSSQVSVYSWRGQMPWGAVQASIHGSELQVSARTLDWGFVQERFFQVDQGRTRSNRNELHIAICEQRHGAGDAHPFRKIWLRGMKLVTRSPTSNDLQPYNKCALSLI